MFDAFVQAQSKSQVFLVIIHNAIWYFI